MQPSDVDVIIPATRQRSVNRLVESLSLGHERPGRVTVVSNEVDVPDPFGLEVRVLRFDSATYAVGYRDVALRCNVGVFFSEHPALMIAGDDQIAARTTIADGAALLEREPYWWGHHRGAVFGDRPLSEIMDTPPQQGTSREQGVNRIHTFRSCYSGSFGFRREVVTDLGGFDMAFNCRHMGEDQQMGHRLEIEYRRPTIIREPPYWWHPSDSGPWGTISHTNLCEEHELTQVREQGLEYETCKQCPLKRYIGPEKDLFDGFCHVPFNPDVMRISEAPRRLAAVS